MENSVIKLKNEAFIEPGYCPIIRERPWPPGTIRFSMNTNILHEQIRRNALSAGCWQSYAGHRRQVTGLLCDLPLDRPTPSLCVLGAGNCNDLDLQQLADRFATMCLVDVDGDAMHQAIHRQKMHDVSRIRILGRVDLTGLIDVLDDRTIDDPVGQQRLRRFVQRSEPWVPGSLEGLAGSFDVVVSVCTISQLIDSIVLSLGQAHPNFLELVFAVRRQHLQLMRALLRSGGRGVLVTDFVSSETCPELVDASPERLPSLCAQLIRQHNFFTGLNPMAIAHLLSQDDLFKNQTDEVRLTAPWSWQYVHRTYAVAAVLFGKKRDSSE